MPRLVPHGPAVPACPAQAGLCLEGVLAHASKPGAPRAVLEVAGVAAGVAQRTLARAVCCLSVTPDIAKGEEGKQVGGRRVGP
jgi:hypothetical protein